MTAAAKAPDAPGLGDDGIREVVLDNGLTAILCARSQSPVVSVQAWYRVGSREEQKGKTGLAHFLEHLMFKGTEELRKGDIDTVTLLNGGQCNADTTTDRTRYYFNFASDRWERALEIEADRMRGSAFDEHEFRMERGPVLEELRRDKDDPLWCLLEQLSATAYSVHPYRNPVIGWAEEVTRVPRDDVLAFYDAWYRPNNCTMVVVGDIDLDGAEARVRKLFGPIPSQELPDVFVPVEPRQEGERRFELEFEVQVPRMLAAYHTVPVRDADDVVLDVASTVLSSGKSSWLYDRLVRRERLAVDVHAWNDTRRDPGLFMLNLELQQGADRQEAENALFEEVDRLATDGPSDADLERARSLLLAGRAYRHATAAGLAETLGTLQVLGGDWRLHLELDRRIEAVTAEDVRRVAGRYLTRRNRTVGWAVPRPEGAPPRAELPGDEVHENEDDAPDDDRGEPAILGRLPRGGLRVELPVEECRLSNGLTVLLLERRSDPLVAVRAFTNAGRLRERTPGLSALTGACRDEGAGGRDGAEISSQIETLGAHLASSSTGVLVRCLARHTDVCLDTLADLMLRPDFPDAAVDRKRGELISHIRLEDDEPTVKAMLRLRSEIYGEHPLGRRAKGSVAALEALTPDDLRGHQAASFVPRNTTLAVVGDFEADAMRARLEGLFGAWEDRAPVVPDLRAPALAAAGSEIRLEEDRDQLHIYLGHLGIRRDDPDFYALLAGDLVLGSGPGFTDRLSRSLRDEQGLAYTVSARIASTADVEPGIFTAYIGTSPKTREKALAGMRHEIERFVAGPITEEELDGARRYLLGSFVFAFQTNEGTAEQLVQMRRLGLPFDYPDRLVERVEALTVDQVQDAVRRHIRPDLLTTVMIGRFD